MRYDFSDQSANSAVVSLSWEKLSIPFKVEVEVLKQQFEAFSVELQNPRSYTPQALTVAAGWALQNNYELDTALVWATKASSADFPGDPRSFPAHSTKAAILDKLGRGDEASAAVKAALPIGTMAELQAFGRLLLAAKNTKAALVVFQFNYDKNPNQFTTFVGMARGSSATGDYAKALDFATKACRSLRMTPANKPFRQ